MSRTHPLGRLAPAILLAWAFTICQSQSPRLIPSPTRHDPTDLELTGFAPATTVFISRAQLLALPQITTAITGDGNFSPQIEPSLRISGVLLEDLLLALAVPPTSDLVDALCTDRYRTHYPADYIAAHHPILALSINGKAPAAWAAETHQRDPGPYFIAYAHFVPTFRILAHADEPQIPENILRLNFTTAAQTFGPITPPGQHPPDSPVAQGFAIAKQNCLRCHSQGDVGGTKSGLNWSFLATIALNDASFFSAYIQDPKKINPHSNMASNPDYDAQTLAALTAYFRTFATNPTSSVEKARP